MNKTQLLALCTRLGIAADDSMTIEQLNQLISAYVPPTAPVANATSQSGKSAVSSFRYMGTWAHVTLKNGVAGIVGLAEQYPFRDLLSLKGSGMECRYERLKEDSKPDKNGKTYPRYHLDWSVE